MTVKKLIIEEVRFDEFKSLFGKQAFFPLHYGPAFIKWFDIDTSVNAERWAALADTSFWYHAELIIRELVEFSQPPDVKPNFVQLHKSVVDELLHFIFDTACNATERAEYERILGLHRKVKQKIKRFNRTQLKTMDSDDRAVKNIAGPNMQYVLMLRGKTRGHHKRDLQNCVGRHCIINMGDDIERTGTILGRSHHKGCIAVMVDALKDWDISKHDVRDGATRVEHIPFDNVGVP